MPPYRLSWDRDALDAIAHFREHDPDLYDALAEVLDELREEGNTRSRAFVSEQFGAFVTYVYVRGRSDQYVIVWRRLEDNRPLVLYVGPLSPAS